MKLIVGLGNPGTKYQKNRHNVGFMILDQLVKRNSLKWKKDAKLLGYAIADGDNVYLKPSEFMNTSGFSVSKVCQFYKISTDEVTVIHDDLDLGFGVVKKQFGAGSAGHRGVESIIEQLGTREFWRIRVGIGRPTVAQMPVEDWVLTDVNKEEYKGILSLDIGRYL